jgi:hypothetical protein
MLPTTTTAMSPIATTSKTMKKNGRLTLPLEN